METPQAEFKVAPQFNRECQVSGIGGWLILPIIGLFVSIFKLGHVLLGTFFPLLASGNWRVLTTPGSEHYARCGDLCWLLKLRETWYS